MARIIFADDDELIGEIVSSALMDAGHAVGWVKDGNEVIPALKFRVPDLVILDQNMPTMTGTAVVREMRTNRAYFSVPILMLTAVSGTEDQNIAFYEGVDDYLTKPFEPEELIFRVEELLTAAKRFKS